MHQVAGAANKCRGPGDRSNKKELRFDEKQEHEQTGAPDTCSSWGQGNKFSSDRSSKQGFRVQQAASREPGDRGNKKMFGTGTQIGIGTRSSRVPSGRAAYKGAWEDSTGCCRYYPQSAYKSLPGRRGCPKTQAVGTLQKGHTLK